MALTTYHIRELSLAVFIHIAVLIAYKRAGENGSLQSAVGNNFPSALGKRQDTHLKSTSYTPTRTPVSNTKCAKIYSKTKVSRSLHRAKASALR